MVGGVCEGGYPVKLLVRSHIKREAIFLWRGATAPRLLTTVHDWLHWFLHWLHCLLHRSLWPWICPTPHGWQCNTSPFKPDTLPPSMEVALEDSCNFLTFQNSGPPWPMADRHGPWPFHSRFHSRQAWPSDGHGPWPKGMALRQAWPMAISYGLWAMA